MPRGWGLESANPPNPVGPSAGPSATAAPAPHGNRPPQLFLPIPEDEACLELHGLTPPFLALEPWTGHAYVRTYAV